MKPILAILLLISSFNLHSKTKTFIKSDTTEIINKNVLYKIYSNQDYIQIQMSTSDKNTILSMLRFGVNVYFDKKGKKKKDVFISYPVEFINQVTNRSIKNSENQEKIVDVNALINDLSPEATYNYYEEVHQFQKDLNSLDVSISFTYNDNTKLLEYRLKIPKQKIISKKNPDFSILSIGIIAGKMNHSDSNKNKSSSINSDMSQKGSRGNRSGGGKRGGSRGNSGSGRGNSQSLETNNRTSLPSIEFWFDAQLK